MRNSLLFSLIAIFALCGCGKKVVSVTGEVLYEDQPAKDIAVLFEPKSDAQLIPDAGLAVTDSNGRFTLKTAVKNPRSGVEPGKYTVYMGWKNPGAVESGDAPPASGAATTQATSPYRFPDELINGNVVVEIQSKKHFVFKIRPEEILWE